MGTCLYYIKCFRAILISASQIFLHLPTIHLLEGILGKYLNLDFHAGLVLLFFNSCNIRLEFFTRLYYQCTFNFFIQRTTGLLLD